jgi:mono/diheme cytochrome c family protein
MSGRARIIGLAAAIAIVAVAPVVAQQSDGDVARGRAFALETCTPCHVVTSDQLSPRRFADAPSFEAIANTRGMTANALHVFLTTPHPTMPDLILSPDETDDVVSYILSLRRR